MLVQLREQQPRRGGRHPLRVDIPSKRVLYRRCRHNRSKASYRQDGIADVC
jgi:hypothetical protein